MTNTPSCVWVSHVDHYSSLASKKSTRRYMHSPNLVKYRLTREEHHLKKDQEGRAPTDQTKQNVPKKCSRHCIKTRKKEVSRKGEGHLFVFPLDDERQGALHDA